MFWINTRLVRNPCGGYGLIWRTVYYTRYRDIAHLRFMTIPMSELVCNSISREYFGRTARMT